MYIANVLVFSVNITRFKCKLEERQARFRWSGYVILGVTATSGKEPGVTSECGFCYVFGDYVEATRLFSIVVCSVSFFSLSDAVFVAEQSE